MGENDSLKQDCRLLSRGNRAGFIVDCGLLIADRSISARPPDYSIKRGKDCSTACRDVTADPTVTGPPPEVVRGDARAVAAGIAMRLPVCCWLGTAARLRGQPWHLAQRRSDWSVFRPGRGSRRQFGAIPGTLRVLAKRFDL